MFPYWAFFLGSSLLALTHIRISREGWILIGGLLTAFVGLRYQVGADWGNYLGYLARVTNQPFSIVFELGDPGYQILNWISAWFGFEVWFVNLVSAVVFIFGLIQFVRILPDPRVALAVAIPYMVIVMAMGYTRQAVGFGFVLWGLAFLMQRKIVSFFILLAVAALFHKSALVLAPLAALADTRNRVWTAVWVGTAGFMLFLLLLQEYTDALYQDYVVSSYASASEGGPVRTLMNALPGMVFIVWRKRFDMSAEGRALWFWVSVLSLCCLPLLAISATAVDRVALYFMPIQLVVMSYLPQFFTAQSRIIVRIGVVALYGAVQFVWLNYATHSDAWLPYQFWLTAKFL